MIDLRMPTAKEYRGQTGRRPHSMDITDVPKAGMALLLLLLTLSLFVAVARGEELYTRVDELSCGDAKVQAVTTCALEPNPHFPECTEQHFLFFNRRAGTSVRVKASGEPAEEQFGAFTMLGGLAGEWACVRGKAGLYVVIGYWTGGNCGTCEWSEVFDLTGKRLVTDKRDNELEINRIGRRFDRKWDSLGLPNPWPSNSFTRIKVLKTDK
jgi:hypothetical protein